MQRLAQGHAAGEVGAGSWAPGLNSSWHLLTASVPTATLPPSTRGQGPSSSTGSLSTGLLVNRMREGMEFAGAECGQWVRGVVGKQERGLVRRDWGWEQAARLALHLCSSAHQGQALSREGASSLRDSPHTLVPQQCGDKAHPATHRQHTLHPGR